MIERGNIQLEDVQFLVVDEADRMLDMGFIPDVKKIVEYCSYPNRQTMMFSATFPDEIRTLAAEFLADHLFLSIGRIGSTTDSITQRILKIPTFKKNSELINVINEIGGKTLVFTATKISATNLGNFLYDNGFKTDSIHGDRNQQQREQALGSFRSGDVDVLVATDVAARGIDVSDVAHVVNYDLPTNIDDYIHRIGRTGRAGKTGVATSFYTDKNASLLKELIAIMEENNQPIDDWMYNENQTTNSDSYVDKKGSFSKPYSSGGFSSRGYGGRGGRSGQYDSGYKNSGYGSSDSYGNSGFGNDDGDFKSSYNSNNYRGGYGRSQGYGGGSYRGGRNNYGGNGNRGYGGNSQGQDRGYGGNSQDRGYGGNSQDRGYGGGNSQGSQDKGYGGGTSQGSQDYAEGYDETNTNENNYNNDNDQTSDTTTTTDGVWH